MDEGTAMDTNVATPIRTTESDSTGFALAEVAAAFGLVVSLILLPWYFISTEGTTSWLGFGAFSPGAVTLGDLLTPFAPLVAVLLAVVALVLPMRPARIAVLVAFVGALWASGLDLQEVVSGDRSGWVVAPSVGPGLVVYAMVSIFGLAAALFDLRRGPSRSSTIVWRAIGRPSGRRAGPWVAYGVLLLVTLPVAAFPMSPRWWFALWLVVLALGPFLVIRRRVRS